MYIINLLGPHGEELNYSFDSEEVAEAFLRGIRDMDEYSHYEFTMWERLELCGSIEYQELICD